ncbi:hypothetical protein ABW19_dt0206308 [Dactylella cylindrospora]|nr:hypothetical protein ABW19_dt0206308 [Dactylella cylindrospora]
MPGTILRTRHSEYFTRTALRYQKNDKKNDYRDSTLRRGKPGVGAVGGGGLDNIVTDIECGSNDIDIDNGDDNSPPGEGRTATDIPRDQQWEHQIDNQPKRLKQRQSTPHLHHLVTRRSVFFKDTRQPKQMPMMMVEEHQPVHAIQGGSSGSNGGVVRPGTGHGASNFPGQQQQQQQYNNNQRHIDDGQVGGGSGTRIHPFQQQQQQKNNNQQAYGHDMDPMPPRTTPVMPSEKYLEENINSYKVIITHLLRIPLTPLAILIQINRSGEVCLASTRLLSSSNRSKLAHLQTLLPRSTRTLFHHARIPEKEVTKTIAHLHRPRTLLQTPLLPNALPTGPWKVSTLANPTKPKDTPCSDSYPSHTVLLDDLLAPVGHPLVVARVFHDPIMKEDTATLL